MTTPAIARVPVEINSHAGAGNATVTEGMGWHREGQTLHYADPLDVITSPLCTTKENMLRVQSKASCKIHTRKAYSVQ